MQKRLQTEDCLSPGWDGLACAVVWQAVEDYRGLLYACARGRWRRGMKKKLEDLETFFKSSWFTTLSVLDGRELMNTLKNEKEVF